MAHTIHTEVCRSGFQVSGELQPELNTDLQGPAELPPIDMAAVDSLLWGPCAKPPARRCTSKARMPALRRNASVAPGMVEPTVALDSECCGKQSGGRPSSASSLAARRNPSRRRCAIPSLLGEKCHGESKISASRARLPGVGGALNKYA